MTGVIHHLQLRNLRFCFKIIVPMLDLGRGRIEDQELKNK